MKRCSFFGQTVIGVMATVALLCCASVQPVAGATVQLITNGGFETGTLAGWLEADQAGGSGTWFVESGTSMPLSVLTSVGPNSGHFYAVTDQLGPGSHVLGQNFIVPIGTTNLMLTFDMFLNDYDGGPYGTTLDYTQSPNEHATADILAFGSGLFDTGAAVVDNLFSGATLTTGTPNAPGSPNPYISYSFDLTGILTPGNTYTLRFGEVDNQFFFNDGIDDVRIVATTGVREPDTFALISIGLAGLVGLRFHSVSRPKGVASGLSVKA